MQFGAAQRRLLPSAPWLPNPAGYPLLIPLSTAPRAIRSAAISLRLRLTPSFPALERAKSHSFRDFSNLLKRDDFLGIGEAYWTRLIEGDDRVLKQAALAISLRKTLEGHSAGARGNKLIQYVTTGITSCHESTTLEEALEKLRQGVYVMLREGWIRKELKELSALKDANVDERRLILVSDVFDPVMLAEEGYMDVIVRTAIELGFSPMQALKMATINPADYWGLRHLGAVAPLRYADILFIDDLAKVSVKQVMAERRIGLFQRKVSAKDQAISLRCGDEENDKDWKNERGGFSHKGPDFTTPGAHHRYRQPHHNEGISRDAARGFRLFGKGPGSRHNPCGGHQP